MVVSADVCINRSNINRLQKTRRKQGRGRGLPHLLYFDGVNSSSRTCQVTDWPGLRVTIPVSIPCHSFPHGSPKLNCSSIAANCLAGGAYTCTVLISGEMPSTRTP